MPRGAPLQIGEYRVASLSTGRLRLDGGGMFGNVPKTLWVRHHPADADNRIEVELRVLLVEGGGRRILIDTGAGNQWSAKERRIYDAETPDRPGVVAALEARGVAPHDVTDVVLTHLHFDHAGGVSRIDGGERVLSFPAARHHVQRANLETARRPNPRERASYLARHREPLEDGDLNLLDGDAELFPGIFVTVSNGHTTGLQVVRIGEGEGAVVFPADLLPLATHVSIPWTMGYDLCPRTLMEEKGKLLASAERHGWAVVLEHDPGAAAVRVGREDGKPRAVETLDI
jgi:glyoxylase-like metal-dependent hydrolase (beta-lactamase superfamily II)